MCARVSDRRLLNAVLTAIGVSGAATGVAYGVLDKVGRQPDAVAFEKLSGAGLSAESSAAIMRLAQPGALDLIRSVHGANAEVKSALQTFDAYLAHLAALGVADSVDVDLSIVRGLAYYTGIVFELFDAKGSCAPSVVAGGTIICSRTLAALTSRRSGSGWATSSSVLKDRGLMTRATPDRPALFVIGGPGAATSGMAGALQLVSVLRAAGFAVDYGLSEKKYQTLPRSQYESAQRQGRWPRFTSKETAA